MLKKPAEEKKSEEKTEINKPKDKEAKYTEKSIKANRPKYQIVLLSTFLGKRKTEELEVEVSKLKDFD